MIRVLRCCCLAIYRLKYKIQSETTHALANDSCFASIFPLLFVLVTKVMEHLKSNNDIHVNWKTLVSIYTFVVAIELQFTWTNQFIAAKWLASLWWFVNLSVLFAINKMKSVWIFRCCCFLFHNFLSFFLSFNKNHTITLAWNTCL